MAQSHADADGSKDRAETIKNVLKAQANKYGEIPEDARISLTVSYENRQGNMGEKQGVAWRVTDGRINFSDNIGTDEEDAYFLRFKYNRVVLISVSERGIETELGKVSNIVIED